MAGLRYTSALTRSLIERIYKENKTFEAESTELHALIRELRANSITPEFKALQAERDQLKLERDSLLAERAALRGSGNERAIKIAALGKEIEELRETSKKNLDELSSDRDREAAAKLSAQMELEDAKRQHEETLSSKQLAFDESLKEAQEARLAALNQVKEADEMHIKTTEELRAKVEDLQIRLKTPVDDYLASEEFSHRIEREQVQAVASFINSADFAREFDGLFTQTIEYVLGIFNRDHPEWDASEAFVRGGGKFRRDRRPPGA